MNRILAFIIVFLIFGCENDTTKNREIAKNYISTTIELSIGNETALLILLHKDGTINRMGNGTPNIDNNFYIGIQKDSLLTELTNTITSDFNSMLNRGYDYPDKKGEICKLEITLTDDKGTTGVRCIYGSKSIGPPKTIREYVKKAIKVTNPWFRNQVENDGK